MSRDTCIDRLRNRFELNPDDPLYYSQQNGSWEPMSVKAFYGKVKQFAKALIAQEISHHGKVAILGFNRVEWVISCLGAQYMGAVSLGIYPTSSKEEVLYLLQHSDAEVLIVQNLEQYEKQVKPILSQLATLKRVIFMEEEKLCDEVVSFKDFLSFGKNISESELENYFLAVKESDVASMIYTSGTTANPKAVMLSHACIAWTVRMVSGQYNCTSSDKMVSYLPLAHVAEQMFTVYAPLECGIKCYLVPKFEMLTACIKQVKPTLFFAVPRVYEKIYDGIKTSLAAKGKLLALTSNYLATFVAQEYRLNKAKEESSFITSFLSTLGKKLIFDPLKEKVGFGNVRVLFSGAAPLSKEILEFFCGFNMPIYEVYGQSEGSGATSLNTLEYVKIGSVGKPLPESEIMLADDDEILLKGPQIFLGYYKDEAATNEVLKDGWLYSGDIGKIDKEGFLHVTDRKKEILITAGGKNISPQSIENMLNTLPFVQSAVVVGDRKKYLSAIFAPDLQSILKKSAELGVEISNNNFMANEKIIKEVENKLKSINSKLSPVEQIKKFSFLPTEFSVDTGEFTPTMKLKRKFVTKKYELQIEKLYQ